MKIGFVVNDIETEKAEYTTNRLALAAKEMGHEAWYMGIGDFAYEPDGSLTPRSLAGSVIHDVDEGVRRAVRMAREGKVRTRDGQDIDLQVDTICVHGDTPGAAALARALNAGLRAAGITIAPPGRAS